eukprot:jgi/Tetstr1/447163/TSEL_034600.t1
MAWTEVRADRLDAPFLAPEGDGCTAAATGTATATAASDPSWRFSWLYRASADPVRRYEIVLRPRAFFVKDDRQKEHLRKSSAKAEVAGPSGLFSGYEVHGVLAFAEGKTGRVREDLRSRLTAFLREATAFADAESQQDETARREQEAVRKLFRAVKEVSADLAAQRICDLVAKQLSLDPVAIGVGDGVGDGNEDGDGDGDGDGAASEEMRRAVALQRVLPAHWVAVLDACAEAFPPDRSDPDKLRSPFGAGTSTHTLTVSCSSYDEPVHFYTLIGNGSKEKMDRVTKTILNTAHGILRSVADEPDKLGDIVQVTDGIRVDGFTLTELLLPRGGDINVTPSAYEFYTSYFLVLAVMACWRNIKDLRRVFCTYKNAENSIYIALQSAFPDKIPVLNCFKEAWFNLINAQYNDVLVRRKQKSLPSARTVYVADILLHTAISGHEMTREKALAVLALAHSRCMGGWASAARPADVANTRTPDFDRSTTRARHNVMFLSDRVWEICTWKTDKGATHAHRVVLHEDLVALLVLYYHSARPVLLEQFLRATGEEDHKFFFVRPSGAPIIPRKKDGTLDILHSSDGHSAVITAYKRSLEFFLQVPAKSVFLDLTSANNFRSIFINKYSTPEADDVNSLVDLGMRLEQRRRNKSVVGLNSLVPTAGVQRFHSIQARSARTSETHMGASYSANCVADDHKFMAEHLAYARAYVYDQLETIRTKDSPPAEYT